MFGGRKTHLICWSSVTKVPVVVRSWYGQGSVVVWSWYGRGVVKVLSRYAPDSLVVRHARTWYMHYMIYCSQYGRGAVRYSLGTLPVRSWYGTLKVHSRLVFSTSLEPGTRTVRFIVRVV